MKNCLRKKCQREFEPKKPKQVFCSPKCRVYHRREEGIKKEVIFQKPVFDIERLNAVLEKLENINFTAPPQNAYDAPKLNASQIQDEPLSFAKLKQQTTEKKGYGDYLALLNAAEDLGQLDSVGKQISASGLNWKERQMLQNIGQQIAKNKFLD
jgi:hypothetical protein